jgi:hypothetical protein
MKRGWIDAYAGARYWNIGLDLELTGPLTTISADRREEWVDPIVGGRCLLYVAEGWFLATRADIGGFGASSDFSWNIVGTVGWDITDWFGLAAGYRARGGGTTTMTSRAAASSPTIRSRTGRLWGLCSRSNGSR